MPVLANLTVGLTMRSAPFAQGMKRAEGNLNKFQHRVRAVTRRASGMFRTLAGVAGIGGLAFALVGAVKSAAAFEKQMASVSTMLDARAMPMLGGMSKQVLELSQKFGEGTESLTKGLYDILSASIAPSKAMKVLETATIAAKAGMTTTALAADVLTTVLNAYAMRAEDAVKVSDILFATVKRGKTTFEELAQTFGMVASTSAVAGLKLTEATAAIATMTRAGLKTQKAVLALNMIVQSFLKPQDDAAEAARRFGFELNATTLEAEGLLSVLERLRGATAVQIAEVFPEARALRGIAPLLQNLSGFAKDIKLTTESAGKTAEAFHKTTDTLVHRWDQFVQGLGAMAKERGGGTGILGRAFLDTFEAWMKGEKAPVGPGLDPMGRQLIAWRKLIMAGTGGRKGEEAGWLPDTAKHIKGLRAASAERNRIQKQAAEVESLHAAAQEHAIKRLALANQQRLEAALRINELDTKGQELLASRAGTLQSLTSQVREASFKAMGDLEGAKVESIERGLQASLRAIFIEEAAAKKALEERFYLVAGQFADERQQVQQLAKLRIGLARVEFAQRRVRDLERQARAISRMRYGGTAALAMGSAEAFSAERMHRMGGMDTMPADIHAALLEARRQSGMLQEQNRLLVDLNAPAQTEVLQ